MHTLSSRKILRVSMLLSACLYLPACIKLPCTSFPSFTIDAECVLGQDPGDVIDGIIDDVTDDIKDGGKGKK